MIKKFLVALFGLIVVLVVLGGVYALMISRLVAASKTQGPPPEAVSVGEVVADQWEITVPSVASVVAYQGIVVSAEAEGVVRKISFAAGAVVKAGDVLVQLDTEVETAQLHAAEAAAALADSNFRRAQELFGSRTISQAELDAADAAVKQAQAQAENLRAVINKKTMRAPFEGRLGIRQINLGQFLNKGAPVVSLQALDPVFVEFSVPQQTLSKVQEGFRVRVTTDVSPGEKFEGKLTAINPEVDPTTRNVRMQATLANPEGKLHPGMFVNAEVILPGKRDVLVIPQTAVLFAPYGDSVFVVQQGEAAPDGKKPLIAHQQFVRVGETRGDYVVVESGLEAGAKIVTAGAFKLRNNAAIVESDIGVPKPEMNPQPADA